IWLAIAAALAPTLLLLAHGVFYTPWSWLPRIVMQFTAGALACSAVRKLVLTDRTQKAAGVASLLMGAAIVGGLYLLDANRPGDML
ncbi:acyltransferase, partial [Mycolicibacterium austroafricanum]